MDWLPSAVTSVEQPEPEIGGATESKETSFLQAVNKAETAGPLTIDSRAGCETKGGRRRTRQQQRGTGVQQHGMVTAVCSTCGKVHRNISI